MIGVLIIADSLSHARSLARLLHEDDRLDVVDVRSAVSLARDSEFWEMADVIVACSLLPAQLPAGSAPVLILADEAAAIPAAFKRNIHAWLPADSSVAEIAAAIIAAANGLKILTQTQAARWLPSVDAMISETAYWETPTPRELQVLRLLAAGLGNKELAGQLGISVHTVKFHVAQILAKLGASSRAEAVSIGIRRGLVPL